jgi:hypothetical protein
MQTLEDSIEIKTTPEKIFNWLINLDKHYKEWHPDHVKCINETREVKEGSIFYSEEYLHGELHKIKMKITKIEKNRLIEFKNLFPYSIICPKGLFSIKLKHNGCIYTHKLYFRMGSILSKMAKSKVEDMKIHMKEECENLKKLLEGKSVPRS